MNERTKQLWEESQQWNGSDDGRGGLKILESVEKFAELIVRECAQVCRDQPNYYALKKDRDNCAVAIEEHFGVESA